MANKLPIIDWSKAPAWAKCHTNDRDGLGAWFETSEPWTGDDGDEYSDGKWCCGPTQSDRSGLDLADPCEYWKDTCQERQNIQAPTYEEGRIAGLKEAADIVKRYKVPVGNSPAGELACDWTMDALREIFAEIEALIAGTAE